MRIAWIDGNLPTSQPLAEHATTRIESALGAFADRIGDVEVRIRDLNAGKGGIDKECRILAYINGAAPITVESRTDDFYSAVNEATARLDRAVKSALDRQREVRPR